ncbi:hypothetical protein BaRGS_00001451 [Batillaria attramentaria]|uniref:Secreted protein n=1 Tax=Batillaria attramentaria TaxID=370345 RepID=A0ABD0M819_9CAEN
MRATKKAIIFFNTIVELTQLLAFVFAFLFTRTEKNREREGNTDKAKGTCSTEVNDPLKLNPSPQNRSRPNSGTRLVYTKSWLYHVLAGLPTKGGLAFTA